MPNLTLADLQGEIQANVRTAWRKTSAAATLPLS